MEKENIIESQIDEVLSSVPEIFENAPSDDVTEVTITLPFENHIVGKLLKPSPTNSEQTITFTAADFEVNKQMRQRGIGRKLLAAAVDWAKAHGATSFVGFIQTEKALKTRASIFGKDNISFLTEGDKEPYPLTVDEIIANDYFPIYAVSDLSRISSKD